MFKNISGLLMLVLAIMLSFVSAKADDNLINRVFPTHVDGTSLIEIGKQEFKCYSNDVQYALADQPHDCDIVLRLFKGLTMDEIILELQKEDLRPSSPSEAASFELTYPTDELITTRIIALDKLFNVNGELKALCTYYSCINTIHTDGVLPSGFYAAVPIK